MYSVTTILPMLVLLSSVGTPIAASSVVCQLRPPRRRSLIGAKLDRSFDRGQLAVDCVAGVRGAFRFDQQDVRLRAGTRTMLDTARNDEQITLPQSDTAVAELDLELALEHEEEVVGLRMAVPDELALDLDHFDLVVVHRRDDARREALVEQGQLLREVDRLVHDDLPKRGDLGSRGSAPPSLPRLRAPARALPRPTPSRVCCAPAARRRRRRA